MSEQSLMYDDYLRKVAQRFENRFADIQAEWGFEYGVDFEITPCRLLRQVLPQRYGICRERNEEKERHACRDCGTEFRLEENF